MYNGMGGVEIGGEKYMIEVSSIDDKNDPNLSINGAKKHTGERTFGANSLILEPVFLSKRSCGTRPCAFLFPGCNCAQENGPCRMFPSRRPA